MSTIAKRYLTAMHHDMPQTTNTMMAFLAPASEQDVSWLWNEVLMRSIVEAWLVNDKETNARGLVTLEDYLPVFLWQKTRTMIRAKASKKRDFLPRRGGAATVAATLLLHIYLVSVCVRLAVDLQKQLVLKGRCPERARGFLACYCIAGALVESVGTCYAAGKYHLQRAARAIDEQHPVTIGVARGPNAHAVVLQLAQDFLQRCIGTQIRCTIHDNPKLAGDHAIAQSLVNSWWLACQRLRPAVIDTQSTNEALALLAHERNVWHPAVEPYVPTHFQKRILDALAGKALTADALLLLVRGDRSRLFRDGLVHLVDEGLIRNDRRLGGYYRPDVPPEIDPEPAAL